MKKILVILFALSSYSIFAQETEKRLALVIGNANYDKGELKNQNYIVPFGLAVTS